VPDRTTSRPPVSTTTTVSTYVPPTYVPPVAPPAPPVRTRPAFTG
jgi:hypothetical protein